MGTFCNPQLTRLDRRNEDYDKILSYATITFWQTKPLCVYDFVSQNHIVLSSVTAVQTKSMNDFIGYRQPG